MLDPHIDPDLATSLRQVLRLGLNLENRVPLARALALDRQPSARDFAPRLKRVGFLARFVLKSPRELAAFRG